MRGTLPIISVLIFASIAAISIPKPASATPPTFTVNSVFDVAADFTGDPNFDICRTNVANSTCTLRAAIMNANRYAGGGAVINIPSGTYMLTTAPSGTDDDSTGDLNIANSMTINGVSATSTIIDGGQVDRVFREQPTPPPAPTPGAGGIAVTISNVTIRNGLVPNVGGGIANYGKLTLNDCVLTGNQSASFAAGGGVINLGGALTLNRTVVTGNRSGNGGGIFNDTNSSLVLSNSVISGNLAMEGGYGGGIFNDGTATIDNSTVNNNQTSPQTGGPVAGYGGGIANFSGTLTMTNSTIGANGAHGKGGGIWHAGVMQLFHVTVAGNIADVDSSGAGSGGGVFVDGGTSQIWNSLLVENYAANEPNDCGGNPITSEDYNYIQVPGCSITGTTTHNVNGADALLDVLQDNGGSTPTRALLAGSPALDQIPPDLCRDAFGTAPVPDQRGVTRPVGPLCDIGAYEGEVPALGYNRNLVRNGDAEAAAGASSGAFVGVPNWRAGAPQVSMTVVPYDAPGGFPSLATDTVPAVHGYNFFAGGNSAVAVSIQDIDLSPLAANIDADTVNFDCSADLGGFLDQEDTATVEYDFLDQASHLLSQVILGPVTAADRGDLTGLLHRDAIGLVPAQTRTVELFVTLTRSPGMGYNDGYADNISLVLTPPLCVGDCDGSGVVNISDLITGVNIVLGTLPVSACLAFENGHGVVDIAQLIKAVDNALNGCGG